MRGGIDKMYNLLFKNIHKNVVDEINKQKIAQGCDLRYYLPIGKSLMIDVPNNNKKLLVVPTMFYPQNLKTENTSDNINHRKN